MRHTKKAAVLLAAAIFMSACGNSETPPDTTETSASSTTAVAADTSGTSASQTTAATSSAPVTEDTTQSQNGGGSDSFGFFPAPVPDDGIDWFDETKLDLPEERPTDPDEMWTVLPYIDETPVNDLQYGFDYETSTVSVIGYRGSSDAVRIPETISGYPVTSVIFYSYGIDDGYEVEGIKELVVPDTVKYITVNKENIEYINIPAGAFVDMPVYGYSAANKKFSSLKGLYLCANYFNSCLVEDCKDIVVIRNGKKYTADNIEKMNSDLIPYRIYSDSYEQTISDRYVGAAKYQKKVYVISDCFNGVENLKIPDYVNVIDEDAFSDCTKLKNVYIPDSVESILRGAFKNCSSLESISLPDSVRCLGSFGHYISSSPFEGCASLSEVTVGDDLRSISDSCFSGCPVNTLRVKNISKFSYILSGNFGEIPAEDCDEIKEQFPNIETLIVEEGAEEISDEAFKGHASLKKVVLPGSLKTIGKSAFEGCTNLESIEIPDGVETLGENAFAGCTGLKSASVGKGVKNLLLGVFMGCTALENVSLSEGLEKISVEKNGSNIMAYNGTFEDCSSIRDIVIPDSVTTIGGRAFAKCTSLKNVRLGKGLKVIGIMDKGSIVDYGTYIMEENSDEKNGPFSSCTSLTEIEIPAGVETIGARAFYDCTSLSKAVFHNGLKEIGDKAFHNCSADLQLALPDSIEHLGFCCFRQGYNYETGVGSTYLVEIVPICDYETPIIYKNKQYKGSDAIDGLHSTLDTAFIEKAISEVY